MDMKLTAMWSDCVKLVGDTKRFFIKAYYHLTAYVPRKLPKDHLQLNEMREVLELYFGLPNRHDVWLTVYGQITSTPSTSLRKSYGSIANAAKRLQVNKVAHEQKLIAIEALKVMLEEKVGELADSEIAQKAANKEFSVAPI